MTPVAVQRRVGGDGKIMVARQRLRIGSQHIGKTVTVLIEGACFRVTCDGEELSVHGRHTTHPVTRFKAYARRRT